MAEALLKQKKIDEAIIKANEDINAGINKEMNLLTLGRCYLEKGEFDKSIEYLNEVIKTGSEVQKINAKNYLSSIYIRQKQFVKAYKFYNEIEESGKWENSQLHNQKCYCLYQMRKFNRALHEATTALIRAEDEERKHNRPGLTTRPKLMKVCNLNECEKYEEALIFIQNKLKKEFDSNEKNVVEQHCFGLWGKAEYDKCIEKCLELLGTYPFLNHYLSLCYYSLKDFPKALEYINEATKLIEKEFPNVYRSFYLKGLIHLALDDPDNAIIAFEGCYKINAKHLEAYIEISKIYEKRNELDKALNILLLGQPQIDIQEELYSEPLFHLTLAGIYYKLNKLDEATELVNLVRKILSSDSMENDFSKTKLLDVFIKYFELYNMSKGYSINDLIFNKDKESEIGHGGFGLVYKGTLQGEEVAIKNFKMKISKDLSFDDLYRCMLSVYHEVSTMENLNFEHLLTIKTVIVKQEEEGNEMYLVTPLCKGGNLSEVLRNKKGESEPIKMSMKPRIKIALQVAQGLQYMHSGEGSPKYIHHDMKSMNILLQEEYNDKGDNFIKICDFGGSRKFTSQSKTMFTPAWAAPETYSANSYDFKVDTYSFGITLWEIFSRKIPFAGAKKDEIMLKVQSGERPPLNELESDTPKDIKNLIKNCLKDRKEERPRDEDIIHILKKLCK